ncbi:MAG: hypothetical protein HW374_1103 [Bacteroidetes bacterium]|nr:hypothetical protein [Bacteroidota bacterium]
MKQETEKIEILPVSSFSPIAERSISSIPEPTVYGGTMMENMGKELPTPGNNRPAARRTRSTFNLMLLLVGSAVAIVLYISNVIKVSQLLAEINKLEGQHRRILMDQELLKAQINKMGLKWMKKKFGPWKKRLKNGNQESDVRENREAPADAGPANRQRFQGTILGAEALFCLVFRRRGYQARKHPSPRKPKVSGFGAQAIRAAFHAALHAGQHV